MDQKYIVNLKGKSYPLWAGILNEANAKGLKSLRTCIKQIPSKENGYYAAVEATAEFEDGRIYSDVGDCSPESLGPKMQHLAPAALRMASTRAKGRCLRDALNIGETMFEELPGEEDETQRNVGVTVPSGYIGGPAYAQEPIHAKHHPLCQTCKLEMSQVDMNIWRPHAPLLQDKTFCQSHLNMAIKQAERARERSDAGQAERRFLCTNCDNEIKDTAKRTAAEFAEKSAQQFGRQMCAGCVREAMALQQANVPSGAISG